MLIEHLPSFMADIDEFKKLFNVEEEIFSELYNAFKKYENNLWIETADDEGIKKREKFLGIDKPYGTLEDRRKVVLSEWSGVLPFNYYTLDKWLSSYLEKYNYTIEISFDEYKLYVLLSLSVKEHETYIKNALRKKIPANMIIEIGIDYNRYRDFKKFTYGQIKDSGITLGEMRESVISL
ncbi:MAG TPA: DUF2313 domain-containing protein [Candidatus Fimicola cottocaccae]|nr:DUF2313 domain-containing protein [Candidatus Fimicola cottocaccae]